MHASVILRRLARFVGGRVAIERRGGAREERRCSELSVRLQHACRKGDTACGCEQLVCAAVAALALAIPPDRSYHPVSCVQVFVTQNLNSGTRARKLGLPYTFFTSKSENHIAT